MLFRSHKSNDNGDWDIYRVAQVSKDDVPAEHLEMADGMRPMALEMIANREAYKNRATAATDQPEV